MCRINDGKRFIMITPKEGEDAEVYLPIECHYLYTQYQRIGPLAPLLFMEYVWEALNILYENFPGHLYPHHSLQQQLPYEFQI